tara:strand:+ start:294 stop:608 length:315 start_codon:yes stop_codon:yes gene_type:complete
MTDITHDFEQAGRVLSWNFLQILSPDVLNELTKQVYDIQADTDDAAEFVKNDDQGKVLFETLRQGLDYLREQKDPDEWPDGMIQLVAWMIRDLVVEMAPQDLDG